MVRPPQDVTEAELAILQVLWDRGTATVRDLADTIYSTQTNSDAATVQKLLGRLETKGCIQRDRDVWPHLYQAAVEREELIGRRLQATANELCDGSLEPLLTHLVSGRKLSAQERESLRSLLNDLDEPKTKKRR